MHVKEKKVELIELFYDLIYVYAISQMTRLMEASGHGVIPGKILFRYFVICMTILQAWLYMTNYVNRYGEWKWYDYLLVCINMTGTVYLANSLSLDWNSTALPFNLSMLVILLTVAALYSIQVKIHPETGAARNSLSILAIVCVIYLAGLFMPLTGHADVTVIFNTVAVLAGAFLPFFIRGKFDKSIINFPHLCERFELITIITFGEAVVGMTAYFNIRELDIEPILVLLILFFLFGCYVMQIHYLVDHERSERALRLMFSHYFIVLSVNLLTIELAMARHGELNMGYQCGLTTAALIIFFTAILSDHIYYHEGIRLHKADSASIIIGICLGTLLMAVSRGHNVCYLTGILLTALIGFITLLRKDLEYRKLQNSSLKKA